MASYPKRILSIEQQIQSYIDAGMIIPSEDYVKDVLTRVGYYRLRGYSYHLYNNATKKYPDGTKFSDIVSLYQFDTELSHLIFNYLSETEVSLRVRLVEALLVYNDSLVLMDPVAFKDKELFWKNLSSVSSEVSRSNDVFIKHNIENHEGMIPIWANVEVMSFGTLSKIIKNLKTGVGSPFSKLAEYYSYKSAKGSIVKPSSQMLSSWVHSVSTLRNMCAHNSRLYNRTINTAPELLDVDKVTPQPKYIGIYQVMLAMKYLRPNDASWTEFVSDFNVLISKYASVIELSRMNFTSDWKDHFAL